MKANIIGAAITIVAIMISTAAMARSHASSQDIRQDTVVMYSGDRAKAFFPAYIKQLKEDSKGSDALSRAAQRALDAVTKNRLIAFQVEMKSAADGSAVPVPFYRTPIAFPAPPENGQTVIASACVFVAAHKLVYRQTNEWQYRAATRQWQAMRNDYERVAACHGDLGDRA